MDINRQGGDMADICIDMKKMETDIFLATEPGICHNHYWIKETLNKTAKKALKHSLVTLSSSKRKYSSYKKPGGAMIIAHGRTRGRITTYGNDEYGRWSWIRLNSKLGGIMVLSAYQVGNQIDFNSGKKGSKTARLQQHSMLQEENRTCTPREAFVRNLIQFLLPARERGDSLLIMGDFNEIFDTNAGMMDVADALGLVDLMEVKL